MFKATIIGLCLLAWACTSTLGDRISLSMLERIAKEEGMYCYKKNAGEYCLWFRPDLIRGATK